MADRPEMPIGRWPDKTGTIVLDPQPEDITTVNTGTHILAYDERGVCIGSTHTPAYYAAIRGDWHLLPDCRLLGNPAFKTGVYTEEKPMKKETLGQRMDRLEAEAVDRGGRISKVENEQACRANGHVFGDKTWKVTGYDRGGTWWIRRTCKICGEEESETFGSSNRHDRRRIEAFIVGGAT